MACIFCYMPYVFSEHREKVKNYPFTAISYHEKPYGFALGIGAIPHTLFFIFGKHVLPILERVHTKRRIIKSPVARNIATYEIRLLKALVHRRKLHLRHCKPFIIAIKLVHLKHMPFERHKIATLVDNARFAKRHESSSRVISFSNS